MQKQKFILVGIIAFCLAAVSCFLKKYNARNPIKQQDDTLEDQFQAKWTTILLTDAKLYNGLYTGMERVSQNTAKKPGQILKEWYSRTSYKWENSLIVDLCQKTFIPAIESGDAGICAKWAELLLQAARAAGITKETTEQLELNETTIRAYVEWNGEELYIGNRVKILHPAWYQRGQIIEQGHCSLIPKESL